MEFARQTYTLRRKRRNCTMRDNRLSGGTMTNSNSLWTKEEHLLIYASNRPSHRPSFVPVTPGNFSIDSIKKPPIATTKAEAENHVHHQHQLDLPEPLDTASPRWTAKIVNILFHISIVTSRPFNQNLQFLQRFLPPILTLLYLFWTSDFLHDLVFHLHVLLNRCLWVHLGLACS